METYEIFLNNSLIETVSLSGIAFLKFETASMLGDAKLVRFRKCDDPILGARFVYDLETGGWEWE